MHALIAGIWLLVFAPADTMLLPFLDKGPLDPPAAFAAVEFYPGYEAKRRLTFWKLDLPCIRQIDEQAAIKAYRDKDEGRNVDERYLKMPMEDVAYVLVNSTLNRPEQGEVVWVAYFNSAKLVFPPPRASLDVAWHSDREKAYVAGPTHHGFSRIPSPRRISSRKSGSKAAAKRFLAMLSFSG